MLIASLVDPSLGFPRRPAGARRVPRHVDPGETQAIAECFISARTRPDPLVALAYQELETQTGRQFARLTGPRGPYTGLARWAAATELHGEVSALWATGQFTEHKAALLDRHLLSLRPQDGPRCRPTCRAASEY